MSAASAGAASAGGMIDVHAHVLPGLDDGPPDLTASAALLAALAGEGVEVVCATPHVNDRYPNTAAAVAEALRAVAGLPGPRVVAGAEVHPSQLARVLEDDPSAYALGSSGIVLVEAEPGIPVELLEASRRLLARRGLRVLLGHVERCAALQRHPDAAEPLVSAGCLLQVTAFELCGEPRRATQRCAAALAERGLVHVVASDAHSPEWRAPRLDEAAAAVAARYGPAVVQAWFHDNPAAVLAGGDPVPPRPEPPAPGVLGRLRRRLLAP